MSREHPLEGLGDDGEALGCSPTYRGVRVGAEDRVLPNDAVQLEWGQPGHEDHGGRGRRRLDAGRRTWNWRIQGWSQGGAGLPKLPR